jgi:hypothetical protein
MQRRDFLKKTATALTAVVANHIPSEEIEPSTRYAMVHRSIRGTKGFTFVYWERTEFSSLHKGDVFNIFELDGTPVDRPGIVNHALCDAFLSSKYSGTNKRVWTIDCEEVSV